MDLAHEIKPRKEKKSSGYIDLMFVELSSFIETIYNDFSYYDSEDFEIRDARTSEMA
jgi:hypothetical protein